MNIYKIIESKSNVDTGHRFFAETNKEALNIFAKFTNKENSINEYISNMIGK